jgi:hypothetical protein
MLRQRVGHIPHQPHFCQRNARAVGWINSGGGRHSRCVNHTRDAARGPRQDHMIAQGGWKRRIFGIGPKCGGLPGSKLVHPFSVFHQYAPPAHSLAPDTNLSPVLHRRPKQQCGPEPWPDPSSNADPSRGPVAPRHLRTNRSPIPGWSLGLWRSCWAIPPSFRPSLLDFTFTLTRA